MFTCWVARYKVLHEWGRLRLDFDVTKERIGFAASGFPNRENEILRCPFRSPARKKWVEKIRMIRIAASGASEGTHDSRRAVPRLA